MLVGKSGLEIMNVFKTFFYFFKLLLLDSHNDIVKPISLKVADLMSDER